MARPEKLGRKKEAAILALLSQRNIEDSARSVGISPRTLYRWMQEPDSANEGLFAAAMGAYLVWIANRYEPQRQPSGTARSRSQRLCSHSPSSAHNLGGATEQLGDLATIRD